MLRDILDRNKDSFGILRITGERHLKNCHRTSFTWSGLPNTLCLAANKQYFAEALDNGNISGIIAPPVIVQGDKFDKAVIISEKANELFYFLHNQRLHEAYDLPRMEYGVHPSAAISERAIIGKNVLIGENVVIHDGSIVHDNTIIRNNSVIHNNVTLGTQGFFSKMILGTKTHVEHFGGVNIGDNCIIHTGTNVSRSVNINEYTDIGDNVHIGIHSNIGHDCKIQNDCDISAKVFLAGRVTIGAGSWIGGSVSVSNAVTIGENTTIKIGSVVIADVPPYSTVSGNFALDHSRNLKEYLKNKNR